MSGAILRGRAQKTCLSIPSSERKGQKGNNPSDVPEIQLFKSCIALVGRQQLAHVAFVKLY